MLLVLLATAMGFILGLTFLQASVTSRRVSNTLVDHVHARHTTESVLASTIQAINANPDWQTELSSGVWLDRHSVMDAEATVTAEYDPSLSDTPLAITNPSAEDATGQLPTPLLGPPLSGVLGGWTLERGSLSGPIIGTNLPRMGVKPSVHATDGINLAYIDFPAGVLAWAQISQTLTDTVQAETDYVLTVDVGKTSLVSLLAETELRVYAGATLLASSADPDLFSIIDLAGELDRYTLRFNSGTSPPSGPLRIEVFAQSTLGLLSTVSFDNVRLVIDRQTLLTLHCETIYGDAGHAATVRFVPGTEGAPATILSWSEP